MSSQSRLTKAQEDVIRTANSRGEPIRKIARDLGTSPGTVVRALARIVDKTRKAEEFQGSVGVKAPRRDQGPYCWDLEAIRGARDDQLRGDFKRPVRLAEAMRTDDALFVAYHNRIAPQSAVQAELVAASGTRGAAVAKKAKASVFVARSTLEGIVGTMANHGIAIGYVEQEVSDDGTRVDMRLTEWPLEHVRWNPSTEQLETRTLNGPMVPIVHGDGRWVVFRKFLSAPWTQEACVLPGAFIWAAHANGIKDWAQASSSHGQAKIMGELPAGIALQGSGGELSDEARAFLTMLQDIVSGEVGAGIRPAGSKTDFLANGSSAWQVFLELIMNREKAAARIYLGTDAILGSVGGAPGVDIATLFGVATTKVQGDFAAVEQALRTGLYEPWCAINFGDSSYAPSLVYQMPDPDADTNSAQEASKYERLMAAIEQLKEQGFVVDQAAVNCLAAKLGVSPAPVLASGNKKTTPLTLAPTDVAKVVRVREARAAQGLDPFGDDRDNMTITELDESLKAAAQQTPPATPAQLTALAGSFEESKHPRADDGKFGSGPGASGGSESDRPKGGEGGEDKGGKEPRERDAIENDLDDLAHETNSADDEASDADHDFEEAHSEFEDEKAAHDEIAAAREGVSKSISDAEAAHAADNDRARKAIETKIAELPDGEDKQYLQETLDQPDKAGALLAEQKKAAEAGDFKAVSRIQAKIEATPSLHNAAANDHGLDVGDSAAEEKSAEVSDHLDSVGSNKEFERAKAKMQKAQAKLDAATEARDKAQAKRSDLDAKKKALESELQEAIDRDGDGRTGAEEEADDDEQPSADDEE